MSEHAIRWTFEDQRVIAEAVCHAAADADCRLASISCECERWGEIQRRDDGTIWHHIADYGDSHEPVWHQVKVADECNICLFINDSGCVEELTSTRTVIDLGETPINPVWLDDGCDWETA